MEDNEDRDSNDASDSLHDDNKDSEPQSPEDQDESQKDSNNHHTEHDNDEDNEKIFNEEEIQNLKDIFDLFDKDQSGKIEANDLESILTSLKRDPEEAKEMLNEIDPNHDGQITFEEFTKLMARIENKIDRRDDGEDVTSSKHGQNEANKDGVKRTALLDFLIMLEDYRSK
jgi:hypothetical protein